DRASRTSPRLRRCQPARARGRAPEEKVALARVSGERCGALELHARLLEAAELGEKVAAHARQEVMPWSEGSEVNALTISRPAAGPNAIASATARFSSTTGDGVSWASVS